MAEENQALAKLSMQQLQEMLHHDMHGTDANSIEAKAHVVFSLPASHPEFQNHIHTLFFDCVTEQSGNISLHKVCVCVCCPLLFLYFCSCYYYCGLSTIVVRVCMWGVKVKCSNLLWRIDTP